MKLRDSPTGQARRTAEQGVGRTTERKVCQEVEHYEGDKVDVSKEAKDLEDERDLTVRQADRFDGGEALLEIGLVICSITLLTKRKDSG